MLRTSPTAKSIAPDRVQAQVERIVSDSEFAGSRRLSQFLKFVVEESLAGCADRLSGRVIGQKVFERGADFDPQEDSIVRVEAGRLRRRLRTYYETAGRQDPIRIDIPKGGYAPTFELVAVPVVSPESMNPVTTRPPWRLRGLIVAAVAVLLALGAGGLWLMRDSGESAVPDWRRFTANGEAFALFLETRNVSRPPTNRERVEAALDLAREVVRLDPEFAGGYAAESFLLWSYVVFGHSRSPAVDGARALELAEKAVLLQPEFGWGHQSLSRARHLTGDLAGAIDSARRAVDLQLAVAELQGNLGILLVFVGRPDEAIAPLREAIRLAGDNARVPFWNYLAAMHFHAGSPEETIAALETNRARGGPTGPHMQVYAAAAYADLGRLADARTALASVQGAGQLSAVEAWLDRVLVDSVTRQQLSAALDRAGHGAEEM